MNVPFQLPAPGSDDGNLSELGSLYMSVSNRWHDKDQERANQFFEEWLRMLQDEVREKEATILEIMARLDLQDERIAERVKSPQFQSLVRKTFRDWAGAESEEKRVWIRNILANAAGTQTSSDDVVRLFIDWINKYSELHFQVIGEIYQAHGRGISRGVVWHNLQRQAVREDSADADLYRLLFRDLSTGGIIRQRREVNYAGQFIAKPATKRSAPGGTKTLVSAFEMEEQYELTELGAQFVHYAMTDLPLKVEYRYSPANEKAKDEE
jgi:hypothetical protein